MLMNLPDLGFGYNSNTIYNNKQYVGVRNEIFSKICEMQEVRDNMVLNSKDLEKIKDPIKRLKESRNLVK